MTTVTNTLINETGDPVPNVPVQIRLLAPSSETNEAFTANDAQIVSRISTKTNSSGKWVLDLIPNVSIEPSGSTYEVIHTIPGFEDDPESLIFIVPVDGATPGIQHLHDLLV